MSLIDRVAAAGALSLAALAFPAPASALSVISAQPEALSAIAAATPALAADARQAAADACLAHNEYGPARVVEAAADGLGDWLVWVKDRDGALWGCNADAAGLVYVNVFVSGDMLDGHGGEFVSPSAPSATPLPGEAAQARARDLCVGVAGLTQEVSVVATVADGLGDTLVWLRLADGQLWMCDASAAAELYVFEPVGFPIEPEEDAPVASAEAPAS